MRTATTILFLSILFLLTGCSEKKEAETNAPPNFLFIISDDQSWVHAGAYGDPVVKTPAFDKLAAEGVLFQNAFCAAPHCSVSRASILTGLNQWQLAEAGTHGSNFPARFQVLPEILMENGYAIGYTGKGWSPGKWDITGRERNPAGDRFDAFQRTDLPAKFLTNTDPVKNFEAFLDQREENQPFWFWYGSIEPHVKYEKGVGLKNGIDTADIQLPPFIPDRPGAKIEMSDHFFEIQWFDRQVADLMAFLEEKGLAENTVVVVTSDNGIVLPRCKRNLYEWGTHMPLAVHWKKMPKKGLTVDRLTSFIDFAPTFLELAGIPVPEEMTGSSFAHILKEGTVEHPDDPPHVLTGFERHDHRRYDNLGYPMRAIRTEAYLLIKNYKPDRWPEGDPELNEYGKDVEDPYSSWTSHYAYFEPGTDLFEKAFGKRPPLELYHIQKDPSCMDNLAGKEAYKALTDSLHRALQDELVKQGDPRELGYGDIFESYPRHGRMKDYLGGFKERGEYNPKYHVHPSTN